MSNRLDLTRQAAQARKRLAYSIAMKADAKGAKAERRAQRMERIARKARLSALHYADLWEA